MSDRAEREKQLDWLYRLKSNLKIFIPKDFHLAEFEQSLDYAISSIKTDLKYDLLYEETKHIADADKMIEPTTKNCRSCRNFGSHHGICEICKDNKCWTEKEPTIKNDVPENNVGNIYICSCGYGWDKSKVVRHHFCPNCGKAVASATKNDLGVDCISREQAIKQCGFGMTSLLIADNLRKLPPVAPQPIKGHWKLVQRGKSIDICCFNCEAVRIKGYAYNYTIDQLEEDMKEYLKHDDMRYCPYCGSDNREVEE